MHDAHVFGKVSAQRVTDSKPKLIAVLRWFIPCLIPTLLLLGSTALGAQEGLFILATLRPVGTAFWLELLAWMVDPGWMAWSSVSLPA